MADSLKFGTSGLRGLVSDLVGAASARYTAAFLAMLAEQGRIAPAAEVLVGRDLRASSPAISGSVIGAILGGGYRPVDCGALPTPALALGGLAHRAPAVMVTGSHIPADRNGLKFYVAEGEIGKADEEGISARVSAQAVPAAATAGVAEISGEALAAYRRRYLELWPADLLAGLRIGVFQHSSVARDLLVDVLAALGAEPVPLGRAESFVAIDTEAVSAEDAAQCRRWAGAQRLDALVSTDGDGDRPLVVDETGELVRGDVLGILTARALRADAVVTPVTSNSAIEGTGWFGAVRRTRVGSPYVIAGMAQAAEQGARLVVGFEANGGVLLGSDTTVGGHALKVLPTRDAMLPILMVLASARKAGLALSGLVATLPPRVARSNRLEHVPSEASAAFIARLGDARAAAAHFAPVGEVAERSDIDGLRFVLATGEVVHYRPSGNAPELRCYTEAASAERAEALLAWGLAAAERAVR